MWNSLLWNCTGGPHCCGTPCKYLLFPAGKMEHTQKKTFTKWVNSQLVMVSLLYGHQSCSQSVSIDFCIRQLHYVCPMHNYTSDHQSSVFKQSLLACVVYLPDVDGLIAIKGLSVTAIVHNILSIVVACIMDIHCLLLDFTASSFQTHFI